MRRLVLYTSRFRARQRRFQSAMQTGTMIEVHRDGGD
jgi:hypothetical protein